MLRPDVDPDWPEAYHLLREAEDQIDLGEVELAMELCRQAAKLSPDDDRVQQSYAWFATKLGFLEEATSAAENATRLDPKDPSNWLTFGYALTQAGRFQDAIQALRSADSSEPSVMAQVAATLAVALAHSGETELVVEQLIKAKALEAARPQDSPLVQSQIAEAVQVLIDRAWYLVEAGESSRAFAIAELIWKIDEETATLYNVGTLARATGHFVEAEQALLDAAGNEPRNHLVHLALGNLYRELRRTEESVERYRIARSLEPDSTDIMNNLALTLGDLGRFDGARILLEEAVSKNPQDTEIRQNLGSIYWELGRLDAAVREFSLVREQAPRNVDNLDRLQHALRDAGSFSEAAEVGEAIREIQRQASNPIDPIP